MVALLCLIVCASATLFRAESNEEIEEIRAESNEEVHGVGECRLECTGPSVDETVVNIEESVCEDKNDKELAETIYNVMSGRTLYFSNCRGEAKDFVEAAEAFIEEADYMIGTQAVPYEEVARFSVLHSRQGRGWDKKRLDRHTKLIHRLQGKKKQQEKAIEWTVKELEKGDDGSLGRNRKYMLKPVQKRWFAKTWLGQCKATWKATTFEPRQKLPYALEQTYELKSQKIATRWCEVETTISI